jgi:hypothetical protein
LRLFVCVGSLILLAFHMRSLFQNFHLYVLRFFALIHPIQNKTFQGFT